MLSIIRNCCELIFVFVALYQSAADNRVCVRLNGQHFPPTVDNHEAEVQFGQPLWRYRSRARAVLIDRVGTGDGLVRERLIRAILGTCYVSAYLSFSRRVDLKLQLADEIYGSCSGRACEVGAGCLKSETTLNPNTVAVRGALLHGESLRKKVNCQKSLWRNHD
jgi:hypothetical protein